MKEEHYPKIVRGYYLTGLGQEALAYYFKITSEHSEYEILKPGDIAVTFYQNGDVITSIPALIRVDGIIEGKKHVHEFLLGEKKDHIPMLPIVSIYEGFDPLYFSQIMESFEKLKLDIRRLAKVTHIQGDLFEFLGEENGND